MSKDRVVGALIFTVCMLLIVGYLITVFAPQYVSDLIGGLVSPESIRFWAVGIVVLIAFLGVLLIGAWIGWTMASMPAITPIEELQSIKTEEEKAPKEEEDE